MDRRKHTKFLVYALVLIMLIANQSVLASVMFHNQENVPASHTIHSQSHHQDQVYAVQSTSANDQDHKKHGNCDGADHCNHCVNLVSSYSASRIFPKSSYMQGIFANYYDISLPSEIRPPKHV